MENKMERFKAFAIKHHVAIDRAATAVIGVSCLWIGYNAGRIVQAEKMTKGIQTTTDS